VEQVKRSSDVTVAERFHIVRIEHGVPGTVNDRLDRLAEMVAD
jgi:hypothetical protein